MRKVVLFIGTVLMVSFGYSQNVKSLRECVDIALQNNLRIKRSYYNVATFQSNLLQAKGAYLPTLNLGGTYGQNYGRALNPVTNLYEDRNSNSLNFNGTSALTLFNGLRIQYQYQSSKRDAMAADEDLKKAKNDVILNVVTLYTNVIFNQELFDNAKFQLNSSQQVLDRITKQVDAGALSRSNQLNQEAQVATNELNMINQENALNLSILQLKQAMQIPASEPLDVEIPDLQVKDLVLEQSAEQIYKIALEAMPEIKSANIKVASADYSLKSSRGSYYPRLTFNASAQSNYSSLSNQPRYAQGPIGQTTIGYIGTDAVTGTPVYRDALTAVKISDDYNQAQQLGDNLFKGLSLGVTVPILNGLNTRTNVQRAIINKELANITVIEAQNTLRQSIETAYNDAYSAARSYASALKQVDAQEEAYRMNKQRLDVGALNIIEYQVSENDLFRSKSDLSRAKYNFIFKKKVLDFYQGNPIDY